jgi:hypothetical protein
MTNQIILHLLLLLLRGCEKSNQGPPIRDNSPTDCIPNRRSAQPNQMMYPTGPQHHGPRKCYTPRCRNHHSPLTTRSGDGATAPAEGKTTSRRAVSPSARGQRRGCSGMGAAKVRPPRRKPASREGPSRSNLDSLKSRQRLGLPRIDVCSMRRFNPKQRAIQQVMEWIDST